MLLGALKSHVELKWLCIVLDNSVPYNDVMSTCWYVFVHLVFTIMNQSFYTMIIQFDFYTAIFRCYVYKNIKTEWLNFLSFVMYRQNFMIFSIKNVLEEVTHQ